MFRDRGMGRGGGFNRSRQFYGVQDFQDTATATTPVALTVANTWYDLPNDGLGPLSSQDQAILGHGPIFNTSTGLLDFSDLSVGDMLKFRVDVALGISSPNTDAFLRLVFGPSFAFHLNFGHDSFKSAITIGDEKGEELPYWAFQIKSTDTLNNPAKFQAMTDGGGDSVEVRGWQVETILVT